MQINKQPIFEALKSYTNETRETQRGANEAARQPAEAGRPAGGDTLVTSQQSALIEQVLTSGAAERAERIEHLRLAYEAGTYRPDSTGIAVALADEWLAPPVGPETDG